MVYMVRGCVEWATCLAFRAAGSTWKSPDSQPKNRRAREQQNKIKQHCKMSECMRVRLQNKTNL